MLKYLKKRRPRLKAFIGNPEGKYKDGLINRRTAEAEMFFGE